MKTVPATIDRMNLLTPSARSPLLTFRSNMQAEQTDVLDLGAAGLTKPRSCAEVAHGPARSEAMRKAPAAWLVGRREAGGLADRAFP